MHEEPSTPSSRPAEVAESPVSLTHLIADGDEDAIAGFRDAHVDRVRAYCAIACRPEAVEDAVEAAFVDFLGRVLLARRDERSLEELLLRSTRSAAAARFRDPELPPSARGELCDAMPELLAARANGELAADDHGVGSHLRHCVRCRANAALVARADAAFQAAMDWEPPEPDAAEQEAAQPEAAQPEAAQPEAAQPEAAATPADSGPAVPAGTTRQTTATARRRTGGLLGALARGARSAKQRRS